MRSAIGAVLMLVAIAVFFRLGFWQLDRAEQKRVLAGEIAAAEQQGPVDLTVYSGDPDALIHRNVRVKGRFLSQARILLEHRKHQGRDGYHVVEPLAVTGRDMILLVNRGWMPARGVSDEVQVPPAPEDEISIEGFMAVPQHPALKLSSQPETDAKGIRMFLDMADVERRLGKPALPLVLLQTGEMDDGLVRDWKRPEPDPGMHLAYAVQWFAFGLIALVLGLIQLVRRRGRQQ